MYIYTYMHNNLHMHMQELKNNNMEFVPMGKILLIFKQMVF